MADINKIDGAAKIRNDAKAVLVGSGVFKYVNPNLLDPAIQDTSGFVGQANNARFVEVAVVAPTVVVVGSEEAYFHVPIALNGYRVYAINATTITAGSGDVTSIIVTKIRSGSTTTIKDPVQIADGGKSVTVTDAADVFSNTDLETDDLLHVALNSVAPTPPNGLLVTFEVRK